MNSEFFNQLIDIGNHAILDGYCKADNVLRRSYTPLCSISVGSDSDLVLDMKMQKDLPKIRHGVRFKVLNLTRLQIHESCVMNMVITVVLWVLFTDTAVTDF